MNIALLSNFSKFLKEATNITVLDFAKELKKNGHNPYIITGGRQGLKKHELIQGIPVYNLYNFSKIPLISNFLNIFLSYPLSINKLKRNGIKFDILHGFSSSPIIVLRSVFSRLLNGDGKIIHTIKSSPKQKTWTGFAWLLNLANIIIVQNKVALNVLTKKGANPKKMRVIHSHININKFKPLNKKKIKKIYGYANKKVILNYGAMLEQKGVDILIGTIPKVSKTIPGVEFVFVSRFKPKEKYYSALRQFRNAKIIFKDVNMVHYVNLSDMVVLPYPTLVGTESNPSCLLESMACKTPVITTDLPELRDIVEPNIDVLMADPGNVNSLSEKIIKLFTDNKLQKTIIETAYIKSKKFSVETITKKILKTYNEALKK
ncbi:MAG: glycosyltransferase [Nanoarchaeota archaeon]